MHLKSLQHVCHTDSAVSCWCDTTLSAGIFGRYESYLLRTSSTRIIPCVQNPKRVLRFTSIPVRQSEPGRELKCDVALYVKRCDRESIRASFYGQSFFRPVESPTQQEAHTAASRQHHTNNNASNSTSHESTILSLKRTSHVRLEDSLCQHTATYILVLVYSYSYDTTNNTRIAPHNFYVFYSGSCIYLNSVHRKWHKR